MLVKRGNVEIMTVIKDDEHKLDDDGTREAMEKAAKTLKPVPADEVKADKVVGN